MNDVSHFVFQHVEVPCGSRANLWAPVTMSQQSLMLSINLTVCDERFWQFPEVGLEQTAHDVDIKPLLVVRVKREGVLKTHSS